MKAFLVVVTVCLFITLFFRTVTIVWRFDGQLHALTVGAGLAEDRRNPEKVGVFKEYEREPVFK